MNADGETIADKKKVKDMIKQFLGDLFRFQGNATYGVKKELVDGGMKYGVLMIRIWRE